MLDVVHVMLWGVVIQAAHTAEVQEYKTSPNKKITLTIDPQDKCKRTVVFEVRACSAVLAIKGKGTMNEAIILTLNRDSVIKLQGTPGRSRKKTLGTQKHDCDTFRTFWLSWRDNGVAATGAGRTVGQNEILRVHHSIRGDLLDIVILSMKGYGDWKLYKDEPPVFISPIPGAVTWVEVPENTMVGKVIYHVEARDPDDSITYDVIGPARGWFRMKGSDLTIWKELNYEEHKLHAVAIRATAGRLDVNTTIIVNVTNVPDEPPTIHLSVTQTIPEELPLGEVIPALFTVNQEQGSEGVTYKLEGKHTSYLDINTDTGELVIVNRIDFDNKSCPRVLDLLTLKVEDSSGLVSTAKLSLSVVNINDNPPKFSEDIYRVRIKETLEKGTPFLTVHCTDPDREDLNNITVTVRDEEFSTLFAVSKDKDLFELSLYSNASMETVGRVLTLTLEARDSDTVMALTATAVVEIRVSYNFTPEWVWPKVINESSIPEFHVLENHNLHTSIAVFNASRGSKSGDIVYRLQSVQTPKNESVKRRFLMDSITGSLKPLIYLDCDNATGGIHYYTITVRAENKDTPENFALTSLKLYIDDIDDNAPDLGEEFYIVHSGCRKKQDEEVVLLTFNVTDVDLTSNITLEMQGDNVKNFHLDKENFSVLLSPERNGTSNKWGAFEVLTVTAHDVIKPLRNTTVHLLVYYDDCSPLAQRRRLQKKGITVLPKPGKGCEVKQFVKDKTVEDYIFKATSGVLGVILVCIAAFYLSKRTVFKSSSPSVNPLEDVQDDHEEEEHKNKKDTEHSKGGESSIIYVGPRRESQDISRQRKVSELTTIKE